MSTFAGLQKAGLLAPAPARSASFLPSGAIRTHLSITPTKEIEKIWAQAEEKLMCGRSNFASVYSSHYLAKEGLLEESKQFFEVRWRGGAGGAPGLAKGSQAFREQQIRKRREREARQAQIKREVKLQIQEDEARTVTVIFKGERFSTTRFDILPLSLLWRHFHHWVKSFSGIPRPRQIFTDVDEKDSVTLRRCTDPRSKDFQKILGKTFKLLAPCRKPPRILHWRTKRHWSDTIPLKDHFSRPITRQVIAKFGLYFRKTKEASSHARLGCAPHVSIAPKVPRARRSRSSG
jgi:hypothetical protein